MQSCNAGLSPAAPDTMATLSGTVHFPKRWPAKDSVNIIVLVLVKPSPPFSDTSLIAGLNTTVLPFTLNYLSSDTAYQYIVPAGSYGYLGVAVNYDKNNILTAWHVVGFAHDSRDSATVFNLVGGSVVRGVDVFVNFDSLPRQPFTP